MIYASPAAGTAVAVVIPCLNAGATLRRTLESLATAGLSAEIVVVDGGSIDDTVSIARSEGARVVASPRGRGVQLAAGAVVAGSPWLLFLHADTVLSAGCGDAVRRFVADPGNRERAGWFHLRFDDDHRVMRLLAWGADRRARWMGLPYGDQGLLMSRAFHDVLGGYRPMPLMEDVDMVRRIGRERLVGLDATAVTSADRYRRDGRLRRATRNLFCLALHGFGVPPAVIARIYGR